MESYLCMYVFEFLKNQKRSSSFRVDEQKQVSCLYLLFRARKIIVIIFLFVRLSYYLSVSFFQPEY
jgi:hypothetical protein